MIVVVGAPAWRAGDPAGPAGLACEVAVAAAARGARVELVGRVGDDAAGDAFVIALNRAGVGHAAILRDPVRPTPIVVAPAEPEGPGDDPDAGTEPAAAPRLEPADVSLALSYLTAFSVLVIADDVPAEALPAALDGAGFAGAHVVFLLGPDTAPPDGMPDSATVLSVPGVADTGAFATVVGVYAAGLDAGLDAATAFRASIGDWEPSDDAGTPVGA